MDKTKIDDMADSSYNPRGTSVQNNHSDWSKTAYSRLKNQSQKEKDLKNNIQQSVLSLINPENKAKFRSWIREGIVAIRPLVVSIISLLITIAESRPKAKPVLNIKTNKPSDLQQPKELQQMSEPEIRKQTPREMVRNHTYPILAAISTIALVAGAASLAPIAQWARSQNECIERTFRIDGVNQAGIPSKVWSCNGGGE